MNKKKGFVFIETIIVIAVLTTVLLMLYSSFISILNQERRNMTFNDSAYIYRTFYVEDFLVSLNFDQYIDTHLETPNEGGIKPLLATFTCHDDSLYNLYDENGNTVATESNKKAFCEYLIDGEKMEIANVYITRYNVKDLVNCVNNDNDITCKANPELRNLSPNAISYLRSLSGDSDNDYRLIIEYKTNINDKDHYMYSNVKIVKRDIIDTEDPSIPPEENEYIVDTEIIPSGVATITPTQDAILYGENSTIFTVTPQAGYVLDSVSCSNGQKVKVEGNTFRVEDISADTLCQVNVNLQKYEVRVTLDPLNAATIDSNVQKVGENKDAVFTVTPTLNYFISEVTCNNDQNGEFDGNIVTIKNVTSNTECKVTLKMYTLAKTFNYSGTVQTFTIERNGIYKLEVWGAQGGSSNGYAGGLGGYSFGNVELKKGEVLYVVVGGAGQVGGYYKAAGGYNGGGDGGFATISGGGGGGATHIATASGILSSLSENKESVLIVAGGGGGAGCSQAATQVSSCNAFGKGKGGISAVYSGGGGGGGYYGGCEGAYAPAYEPVAKAGTGGTGFIKENFIANSSNIQYGIQRGNGLAKITFVSVN